MARFDHRALMISFRTMTRADYPLMQRWLAAPHVAVWWNEPHDLASIEAKYGRRIDGQEPIPTYVIEFEGSAIGWIQWYRWRDFPEHASRLGADATSAGIDLALGELAMTGQGWGPVVIRTFATDCIFVHADVTAVVDDPSGRNARSVMAFEKAGFRRARQVQLAGEDFERVVVRLERPCVDYQTSRAPI
jgi:aminoglycoside 6'-N-acetyltransferase